MPNLKTWSTLFLLTSFLGSAYGYVLTVEAAPGTNVKEEVCRIGDTTLRPLCTRFTADVFDSFAHRSQLEAGFRLWTGTNHIDYDIGDKKQPAQFGLLLSYKKGNLSNQLIFSGPHMARVVYSFKNANEKKFELREGLEHFSISPALWNEIELAMDAKFPPWNEADEEKIEFAEVGLFLVEVPNMKPRAISHGEGDYLHLQTSYRWKGIPGWNARFIFHLTPDRSKANLVLHQYFHPKKMDAVQFTELHRVLRELSKKSQKVVR